MGASNLGFGLEVQFEYDAHMYALENGGIVRWRAWVRRWLHLSIRVRDEGRYTEAKREFIESRRVQRQG